MNQLTVIIVVFLCIISLYLSCSVTNKKQIEDIDIVKIAEEILLEKTLGEDGMAFLQPEVLKRGVTFFEMVESGVDNKLLVLNKRGEFCYLDLTDPSNPRLEVITPGFPGVDGELGSDPENRVAWLARGRGVYMIDLDTKKKGHMIAGNSGQLDEVLMTDKERLLFIAITYSGEANLLYAYELSTGTDYGQIAVARLSDFFTLGNNTIMWRQTHPSNPTLSGWYLTDSLFEEVKEMKERVTNPDTVGLSPGEVPLTKALTEKGVEGLNATFQKHLHQDKRLLYGYSTMPGTNIGQDVMVRWSSDFQKVEIETLVLQQKRERHLSLTGPSHMSGDGNWITGIRNYWGQNPNSNFYSYETLKEELVVYHLQDHYPQGMSMPISLGYTEQDTGAFLNHSTLGPLYIEKPYTREDVLLMYKLNDGPELLTEQENRKKTEKPKTLAEILDEYPEIITPGFPGVGGNNESSKDIALYWAAKKGDTEAVKILIEAGANVSIKNSEDETALHSALYWNETEIALALINAEADLNIQNKKGETPLYWAASMGRLEVVKALIETGADLNIQNKDSKTALSEACSMAKREVIALLLINAGADVNTKISSGETPLYAAAVSRYTEVVKALIEAGADVNIKTNTGNTTLHEASSGGDIEMVKALIEAGADVNTKTNSGGNALYSASIAGYSEMVKLLIAAGADVAGMDVNIDAKGNGTALIRASDSGYTETVKALIVAGVDLNVQTEYSDETALFRASDRGHTEIVKALIVAGADLNIQNNEGETPLYEASYKGHTEIALALINAGADLNIQTDRGDFALYRVSFNGHTEIALALINAGADLNIQNNEGYTALTIASENRHREIVKLLKAAGAKK